MHSPVVGVVLAGGVGERMGLALPKQLVPVAGRTSLEHTVACFQESKDIDRIIVMMEPAHLDVGKELVATAEFPKVTGVFPEVSRATTVLVWLWNTFRSQTPRFSSTTRSGRCWISASSPMWSRRWTRPMRPT